jgi:DNA-binding beta-propeller fold protein YncE
MQFTSTSFSDLKGLAVDEAGKKAYVLNGNDVYALDLNN